MHLIKQQCPKLFGHVRLIVIAIVICTHIIYNVVSFGVGFNNEEQGICSKTADQERI